MPLDANTLALVRSSLQERREDIARGWSFTSDMTEDEVLTRYGFFSSTPSSLHVLHFGEYQLLGRLIEDCR
jgi:hypothetical protein